MDDAHFVGVKIGDINGDVKTNLTGIISSRSNDALILVLQAQPKTDGQSLRIDVTAEQFNQVAGMQFGLELSHLNIIEVISGSLIVTTDHYKNAGGVFNLSWTAIDPVTIADGQVLFSLIVESEGLLEVEKMIRLNSQTIAPEAYIGDDLQTIDVTISGRIAESVATGNHLFSNEPNPFSSNTIVRFQLEKSGCAILHFYDVNGALLHVVKGEFEKGIHEVEVQQSDLGMREGIVICRLESGNFVAMQKMVMIR